MNKKKLNKITIHKIIFVLILVIVPFISFSQDAFSPNHYGFSLTQSVNDSPDGGLLTIGLNLVKDRRTYELAAIVDDEENINGLEFVHKFFINKKKSEDLYSIKGYKTRPHIIYNLVYLRAISKSQINNNLIINGSDFYTIADLEKAKKVTTIHHYIGLGLERDIFQHVFLNFSLLTGLQFGKNNNNNKIDSSNKQYQENAYLWNVKLGFGYRF